MKILRLAEFENPLPLNEWCCSLMWCPSQCYRHVVDDTGTHSILYLRWRWDDPWQAHIIRNATAEINMSSDDAIWTEDLFEAKGLFFTDEQVAEAKNKLLEIWAKEA